MAKYIDTDLMTPYVYKDTTGNGGGNGGNGGDTSDVRIVMAEDGNAFVAYPNPFRQRVNIEYSGQQPITAAYLTDIMGRTEQVELSATAPGRYTLDLTARPQAAYLLTLVTQDGHRHTVRLLKQSEVFGQ
ncbi:MAG: T9SS type A sorting domain-containing protein [Bacteroidales bacterium]|nr:T9SS type A sorting domain-containing protein [Bacteroidales bacterium]